MNIAFMFASPDPSWGGDNGEGQFDNKILLCR